MKAVIMAGGEGRRLKSVTGDLPKPMVPLLGKPLMERCIELLLKNGINELCATLRYNPGPIMDYFGDGDAFGVDITWRVETQPLGTAGGVKACMDVLEGAPFLVMSGDAACDFDLRSLIESHERSGAAVTLALYECREPLRYGLAVPDENGDVRCFIEKPDWPHVVGDLVSTGIYVVSPEAMELVPDGEAFDFASGLFPELLRRGRKIHGEVMSGYWCDVGTPQAYYQCCADALAGKLRLPDQLPPADSAGKEAKPRSSLAGKHIERRSLDCADRARLMRAVSASLMECGAEFDDGVVLRSGNCCARISPSETDSELVIEAASGDSEFSGELASALENMARDLERDIEHGQDK